MLVLSNRNIGPLFAQRRQMGLLLLRGAADRILLIIELAGRILSVPAVPQFRQMLDLVGVFGILSEVKVIPFGEHGVKEPRSAARGLTDELVFVGARGKDHLGWIV